MYKVVVLARQATEAGVIDSVESIPLLHKSLKIPAQALMIYHGPIHM
jgi:hypothetical protein